MSLRNRILLIFILVFSQSCFLRSLYNNKVEEWESELVIPILYSSGVTKKGFYLDSIPTKTLRMKIIIFVLNINNSGIYEVFSNELDTVSYPKDVYIEQTQGGKVFIKIGSDTTIPINYSFLDKYKSLITWVDFEEDHKLLIKIFGEQYTYDSSSPTIIKINADFIRSKN
ncbi:MAG: hypothetical protein A2015_12300 [Spirochaetes bacterium GWF1_31_7]|nr:MAG: hypothetical protein A2Y30_10245 [Spirochaetes bacterium GWE1_32_154]OHD51764.1 MAG: hypothetical protein A2015_12300 [Spirochaetes bacterium GWF1_31_7]OHD52911.1 MAG: hypothetical protein A2Y29_00705 [Spirochaetes bacterium GWE2_31_10]OHD80675.1 MAG: hypothetical protein A2355_17900 [Spirochaetes bacterium RIFOXYB1_FULL_32_8]HBD94105.1 hypothetical protein [Spirochaetia bacterium]